MQTNRTLELIYGQSTLQKVSNSNVLVVGAGGIGCELIKNLGNSGFNRFTIIDLDTIEVSNLNRQFYFRKHHAELRRSKAEVVRECILAVNPNLDIIAYKASIFDNKFDINFYRQFDVVYCALDNKEAREHLGKMCTRSYRKLVDAGTQGYSGQVKSQVNYIYECNHCKPIPPPQTYAMCTIRNDPSQPIHCIFWSKSLYEVLLGPQDQENFLSKLVNLEQMLEDFEENSLLNCALQLFEKVFYTDIISLKQVDNSKGYLKPITFEEAIKLTDLPIIDAQNKSDTTLHISSQKLWTIADCARIFIESFIQSLKLHSKEIGLVKFDKDDDCALNFVCAATNLRTYNYLPPYAGINKLEFLSLFDVKEKAGNIIPAIASTNAIVAGIQVIESVKILENRIQDLRAIWLANQPPYKLTNTFNAPPKLTCNNCSEKFGYINMKVDMSRFTLGDLKDIIINHYRTSSIKIYCGVAQIYNENEQDEDYKMLFEENLSKTFENIAIELGHNTFNTLEVSSDVEPFYLSFYFTHAKFEEGIIYIEDYCQPQNVLALQYEYIKKSHQKEIENKAKYYNRYIF